jgi:cytochrome c oxidase subunit 1
MHNAIDNTNSHADHHDDHHGPEKGFKRWLFTTNHKDIGTLYLTLSLIMFFVAGTMALIIRVELFEPGKVLVNFLIK